jgi:hypothetical protein
MVQREATATMYERAFVTVSDATYLPGLWALLNSIWAYHGSEYRVFVVGHRLPASAREQLTRHPLGSALTVLDDQQFAYLPAGAWEAKQCALAYLCGRVVSACLLDADLVLLSRLDDAFTAAEHGSIVTCWDGNRPIRFGEEYRSYGMQVPGRTLPYFNSGFVCLNLLEHWDLAALWEFTSRFGAYSPSGGAPYSFAGHGDQGVLNAVAALLEKSSQLAIWPEATWCNSAGWSATETVDIVGTDGPQLTVRHRRTRELQRVLHSTGPKWWTSEGHRHFGPSGDVMKCFDHFAGLHPVPAPKPSEPASGTLRYVGDISRQDAQVLADHAGAAHRILEFGVGASTQVLAQVAPPGAIVTAVETDPDWVARTEYHLGLFGVRARVDFVSYREWLAREVGVIDLAFVDGLPELRPDFAGRAWRALRVGGVLLVHDTRRAGDVAWLLDLLKSQHLEVDSVAMNVRASNITVVRKKVAEPYVNWNMAEEAARG